jgi:hypothetical protein
MLSNTPKKALAKPVWLVFVSPSGILAPGCVLRGGRDLLVHDGFDCTANNASASGIYFYGDKEE